MAQVVDGDVLHHRVEIGAAGAWRTVRRGGRIAFAALAFGKAYPGVMHQVTRGLRAGAARHEARSEEHTSELQSQSNLVCRLLLEKKKKKKKYTHDAYKDQSSSEAM